MQEITDKALPDAVLERVTRAKSLLTAKRLRDQAEAIKKHEAALTLACLTDANFHMDVETLGDAVDGVEQPLERIVREKWEKEQRLDIW